MIRSPSPLLPPPPSSQLSFLAGWFGAQSHRLGGSLRGHLLRLRPQGVGFRLWLVGSLLLVDLGWSAFRLCRLPAGVRPLLGRGGALVLLSPSLPLVATLADRLLRLRRLDPYRSKGLRLLDRPLPPSKKPKKDGK